MKTVSSEGTYIMLFVFFITFFNTVVIVLIVNCNFIESENPILKNLLQIGSHTDFNKRWYMVMGPMLLLTVFLNTVVPIALELAYATLWFSNKAYDKTSRSSI